MSRKSIFAAKRFLQRVASQSTRDKLKDVLRRVRYFRSRIEMNISREVITIDEITSKLKRLGVQTGDVIIIHSSLSRMGMVDGGVEAIVAALKNLVGSSGTIVVPTLHLKVSAVKHFASGSVFDVVNSESRMGALSEYLRKLPEARRSLHPTHSASAIGPHAEYLTQDHHKDILPFGSYSPYSRIAELGGKSLMLGVPIMHLMSCRVIEDILGSEFPYPVYLKEMVKAKVIDENRKTICVPTKIHNPEMSKLRRNTELEPYFFESGIMHSTIIGRGNVLLVDAQGVNRVLMKLMEKNITVYTPDGKPLQSILSGNH